MLNQLFNLDHYFFNPHSVGSFLVAGLAFAEGFFFYCSDRTSTLNRCIIISCMAVFLWMMGVGLLLNSTDHTNALVFSKVLFSAIVLLAASSYHLSAVFSYKEDRQRFLITLIYSLAILEVVLVWQPHFFSGIKQSFFGLYPRAGFFILAFVSFQVICMTISFVNLLHEHFRHDDSQRRVESRWMMFLFLILQFSFIDIFASYESELYPGGYIFLFGFLLSMNFYQLRTSLESSDYYQKQLESKSKEVSEAVEELRATQLKLLESGKISALASLSAGILHQISQPITAIHGFAKFLKKEMDPKETFHRPICLIEEQSVYLKQMLGDLMELIRHREIVKQDVDINEVIERAMNLLTDELRIRRINWDLALQQDLAAVYADGTHLQQIFMNIVINAIQAMRGLPRGAERYLKIATRYEKEEEKVYVSFKDTGPGITSGDKNRVFDPFFSTKSKGAGMGLALCYDLIEEHGGTISVDSSPDQGANFIICLPAVKGHGAYGTQDR